MVYLTEEFHYGVGRTHDRSRQRRDRRRRRRRGDGPARAARKSWASRPREWTDLGVCDPFTSVVVSPTRLFLARGLSFGPTTLEGTEQIRCRACRLPRRCEMVLDSRITHAPSCVLILKAAAAMLGRRYEQQVDRAAWRLMTLFQPARHFAPLRSARDCARWAAAPRR